MRDIVASAVLITEMFICCKSTKRLPRVLGHNYLGEVELAAAGPRPAEEGGAGAEVLLGALRLPRLGWREGGGRGGRKVAHHNKR